MAVNSDHMFAFRQPHPRNQKRGMGNVKTRGPFVQNISIHPEPIHRSAGMTDLDLFVLTEIQSSTNQDMTVRSFDSRHPEWKRLSHNTSLLIAPYNNDQIN